ncbi:MAG: TRAM domain-containing protein [Acutalibacteraceae bacterium]
MQKKSGSRRYIFPYSVRTGTRAALMKPQIEKHVKEKGAALAVTAEKIRSDFLRSQIGKTVSIIPETHGKEGFVFGYTENYTPVMAKVSKDTIGKTILVKITDSDKDYCYAKSV